MGAPDGQRVVSIMRRILACWVGAMVLMSGCSSGDGDDKGLRPADMKASVDDLAAKVLPALAKKLNGEFPLARGRFVGCDAGRDVKRYVASGELHAEVADNAKAAEKIRATLAAVGVDATTGKDSTVTGTLGDLAVVVEPNVVSPNSVVAIRPLTIASECGRFAEADVAKIKRIKPKVYGEPVTGAP